MNREDVLKKLKNEREKGTFSFVKAEIDEGTDLSSIDFSGINFKDAIGENINFSKSNLSNCNFEGTRFEHVNFDSAILRGAILKNCDMRFANFHNADARGTKFSCTIMERSNHDGIIIDDTTQNYRMVCPEKGAFLGYKKCFNNLLVTLLIPEDARRVSSTTRPCRCDKAKVINITSFDGSVHYTEAWSLCASTDFKYTLGEYVYPDSFNPDRWMESTHGIHFWMTREEAIAY